MGSTFYPRGTDLRPTETFPVVQRTGLRFFRRVARTFLGIFRHIGLRGFFLRDIVRALADPATWAGEMVRQMRNIGVDSVPLASIVAAFIGAVIAIQIRYQLFPPRLLAALVMLPTLVIVADAVGLGSAYFISVLFTKVPATDFKEGLRLGYGGFQLFYSLLKATLFGWAIAFNCSYEGYITETGAEGVGRSTARAVVITSVVILVLDAITAILLGPFLQA